MKIVRLAATAPREFAMAVIGGAIAGMSTAFVMASIQAGIEGGGGGGATWRLALMFVVAIAAHLFSRYVTESATQRVNLRHIAPNLRNAFARQLLTGRLDRIEAAGVGRLVGAITADVRPILFGIRATIGASTALITIVACLAYFAFLSWQLFLVALAVILIASLVGGVLVIATHSASRRALASRADADEKTQGVLRGFTELKLHPGWATDFVERILGGASKRYANDDFRSRTFGALGDGWISLVIMLAVVVALVVRARVSGGGGDGDGGVSSSAMASYVFTVLYLQGEAAIFFFLLGLAARGEAALRNRDALVGELELDDVHEVDIDENATTPRSRSTFERITMRDVEYVYSSGLREENFMLGPITIDLHPGEIVFVTGGNGSGKSTLLKVLLGLYPATRGTVAEGSDTFTWATRESYRALFSYVPFEPFVFNELYGLEDRASSDLARDALALVGLAEKVKIDSAGAFTSTDLSHGQKKRLALATAIIEDRPIVVLDEWAANQDPETRELFYRTILPALKRRGKTVLAITHDDQYFDAADRILKLEEGRFV